MLGPFIWRGPRGPDDHGHRVPPPDHTAFDFHFYDAKASLPIARRVLDALSRVKDGFPFDQVSFDTKSWGAFGIDTVAETWLAPEPRRKEPGRRPLYGAAASTRVEMEAFWGADRSDVGFGLRLAILTQLLDNPNTRERALSAFDFLCGILDPDYAYGATTAEFYEKSFLVRNDEEFDRPAFQRIQQPPQRLPGVMWLNHLGDRYTKKLAHGLLDEIPAARRAAVGKGATFLVSENPLEFRTGPARRNAKEAERLLSEVPFFRAEDVPDGWSWRVEPPYS